MTEKAYYYFCKSCGADTASYEMYAACPYCHATRRELQLVGECTSDEEREEMIRRIQSLRMNWLEEHGGAQPGERRRRGWFFRK
ncbi:hypothetical protein [Alicyclobacillus herbarius]|uniref:hypothetical protein n=1 Tax=Alicyclobacillus herbarius TaxID=122960 RepID=UPI000424E61C|nr:hypothetical protein [Alicyclobacillus herbarius]